MKKNYTIVLQSSLGLGALTGEQLYYDWSQIEEASYKVTFSFMSGQGTVPTNINPINVFLDLGQGAHTSICSSWGGANAGTVYSPSFLGSLEYGYVGTNVSLTYYFARPNTNPAVYIDTRPRNNILTVQLFTNVANQGTVATVVPGPYTLILSLEEI